MQYDLIMIYSLTVTDIDENFNGSSFFLLNQTSDTCLIKNFSTSSILRKFV